MSSKYLATSTPVRIQCGQLSPRMSRCVRWNATRVDTPSVCSATPTCGRTMSSVGGQRRHTGNGDVMWARKMTSYHVMLSTYASVSRSATTDGVTPPRTWTCHAMTDVEPASRHLRRSWRAVALFTLSSRNCFRSSVVRGNRSDDCGVVEVTINIW